MSEQPDEDGITDDIAHRAVIDVERIVEDIQRRAEERRGAGAYDGGILDARIDVRPGRVTLRPQVAYSAKPVVGPFITGTKRLLIRLQYHFLDDLVAQTNRAIELSRAQTTAEAERRKDLQARVANLEARLAAAEEAIGRLTKDAQETSAEPTV